MRFRLYPSTAQEVLMVGQCSHARYVWNLGLEQRLRWRRCQGPTPGFNAQAAQLTEARRTAPWLACGSQTVQQQALREVDRRKDWVEKTSTDLATSFDVIRVENLNVKGMTRSARGTVQKPGRDIAREAGLNRGILKSGWGLLVTRLEQKAPGRVEKVKAAYTSQTMNITAGHAVTARRDLRVLARAVKREPQHTRPPKVA